MNAVVHVGDCLEVMPTLDAGSFDAIVTDPPYALVSGNARYDLAKTGAGNPRERRPGGAKGGFMGKAWDAKIPGPEYWAEALRVAKPGAHLVAFGGTRTYHRLTVAIEDAGWEIRDCLSWLYGSGFPKSHNGVWGGTALKPAWEPIILARKPLEGTVAGNVERFRTGALNVDGCRIATDESWDGGGPTKPREGGVGYATASSSSSHDLGRWPANVVLDEEAARLLDEQSGDCASKMGGGKPASGFWGNAGEGRAIPRDDSGGASRFFYTAKASRAERNAGLDDRPDRNVNHIGQRQNNGSGGLLNGTGEPRPRKNYHPTVKPLDLMQWLCRLVTPKGGLILDPFCGSGTTGRAAVAEGFRFVGIEKEAEYAEIARARIAEYAPLFSGGAA